MLTDSNLNLVIKFLSSHNINKVNKVIPAIEAQVGQITLETIEKMLKQKGVKKKIIAGLHDILMKGKDIVLS